MTAIIEEPQDGPIQQIKVLFCLYPGMDTLDFTGPLEIFHTAQHNINDPSTAAFKCIFAGPSEQTESHQGCSFKAHIDYAEAYKRLKEVEVLVVPGGQGNDAILKKHAEPIGLIKAFGELQKKDPSHERTLLSICTGSLLLAKAGVLQGLSATTHPDFYTRLEIVCREASRDAPAPSSERTDVVEERYVVNNGRFDLGENIDENPFVISKQQMVQSNKERRRSSLARKGSNAWMESNTRRESFARRASMKLGGLRVITSGGVTAGLDASLYLVCAMVSEEAAHEVARLLQYTWIKGVVVDALDV